MKKRSIKLEVEHEIFHIPFSIYMEGPTNYFDLVQTVCNNKDMAWTHISFRVSTGCLHFHWNKEMLNETLANKTGSKHCEYLYILNSMVPEIGKAYLFLSTAKEVWAVQRFKLILMLVIFPNILVKNMFGDSKQQDSILQRQFTTTNFKVCGWNCITTSTSGWNLWLTMSSLLRLSTKSEIVISGWFKSRVRPDQGTDYRTKITSISTRCLCLSPWWRNKESYAQFSINKRRINP